MRIEREKNDQFILKWGITEDCAREAVQFVGQYALLHHFTEIIGPAMASF
jgi:hypothetical protein